MPSSAPCSPRARAGSATTTCAPSRPDRIGQFRPLTGANPTIGQVGAVEQVEETRCEVPFDRAGRDAVLATLRAAHPYEEPVYYVIPGGL